MGRSRTEARVDDGTRDPLLLAVGERIWRARTELGMTLQDVADDSGLTKDFVWRVEAGRQAVTVKALAQMARGLRTTMAALLDDLKVNENGTVAGPQ